MPMSQSYGPADEKESIATLHRAIEIGCNFFDTPRYQGENFDANVKAAKVVFEIATAKNVKPGQVALAWILQKGDFIVPIPGTKHRNYLEENVAAETVQLDLAQMKVLDDALAPRKVSGQRYAAWIMATIDR
jgi:aryl-alcohol dehydrogenase-like predicted oxidoreductase